ncbi:MAG TPA: uroporphyrinogen synthase, partial [Leptospiraceae bacterium]|nr:uroporphyrinogen synthase [Leptospiraceae bacterium]
MYSSIRIASRKSPLARIQSYLVARAIRRIRQEKPIEYYFRETVGDKDQVTPLAEMKDRGIFTKDFKDDLLSDKVDIVVHSWKDVETEESSETEIISVLGRADQRDILLFKKEHFLNPPEKLVIMSSSPRREYNLKKFFSEYLPEKLLNKEIIFEPVRGNLRTRARKWQDGTASGIVFAKAGIDRILIERFNESGDEELKLERDFFHSLLNDCLFLVLPLSSNPNAPAQGGIAVEIRKGRDDLRTFLKKMTIKNVDNCIRGEREELMKYGGGCHQKIGVSILQRDYGTVMILKGETDDGKTLDSKKLFRIHSPKTSDLSGIWPLRNEGFHFSREYIPGFEKPPEGNLLVTRMNAWQDHWKYEDCKGVIWTAGVKTMKELCKKNIWVSGTLDALGEDEHPSLEHILPNPDFIKLTHDRSKEIESVYEKCYTYILKLEEPLPDLRNKTHFFWMSAYQFDLALEHFPEIADKDHSSGPGITRIHIENRLNRKIDVFLSYEEWL